MAKITKIFPLLFLLLSCGPIITHPTIKVKNNLWSRAEIIWLQITYDKAWSDAVRSGLLSEADKLPIEIQGDGYEKICLGISAGALYSKILFCNAFIRDKKNIRIFLMYHEIGHIILGHNKSYSKDDDEYTKRECEANVMAAKLLGNAFALSIIDSFKLEDNIYREIYTSAFSESALVIRGVKSSCFREISEASY